MNVFASENRRDGYGVEAKLAPPLPRVIEKNGKPALKREDPVYIVPEKCFPSAPLSFHRKIITFSGHGSKKPSHSGTSESGRTRNPPAPPLQPFPSLKIAHVTD